MSQACGHCRARGRSPTGKVPVPAVTSLPGRPHTLNASDVLGPFCEYRARAGPRIGRERRGERLERSAAVARYHAAHGEEFGPIDANALPTLVRGTGRAPGAGVVATDSLAPVVFAKNRPVEHEDDVAGGLRHGEAADVGGR